MARRDPEKHKEQVRRANRARYRADVALREKHPDEHAELYAKFAADEGVDPTGPRPRREREVKAVVTEAAQAAQAVVVAPSITVEPAKVTPEPAEVTVTPPDPFGPLTPIEAAQAAAEDRRAALRAELEPALDE